MNREDLVRMAVKAGGYVPTGSLALKIYPKELEVLASLIIERYLEEKNDKRTDSSTGG